MSRGRVGDGGKARGGGGGKAEKRTRPEGARFWIPACAGMTGMDAGMTDIYFATTRTISRHLFE